MEVEYCNSYLDALSLINKKSDKNPEFSISSDRIGEIDSKDVFIIIFFTKHFDGEERPAIRLFYKNNDRRFSFYKIGKENFSLRYCNYFIYPSTSEWHKRSDRPAEEGLEDSCFHDLPDDAYIIFIIKDQSLKKNLTAIGITG